MEPTSLPDPGVPAGNSSSVAQETFRVLLGVTGSVAALKLPLLVAELLKIPGLEVKVVTTERAKHFYNAQEIPVTLYGDEEEWQLWKGRSDPVLHIELRRWADLMVVAPLDANTLAKVANGICDNLLTCVIRAWDLSKPLLFCPAMNTAMWEHPITARQVEQLKGFGYTEIPCVVKKLVCGDEGTKNCCVRREVSAGDEWLCYVCQADVFFDGHQNIQACPSWLEEGNSLKQLTNTGQIRSFRIKRGRWRCHCRGGERPGSAV